MNEEINMNTVVEPTVEQTTVNPVANAPENADELLKTAISEKLEPTEDNLKTEDSTQMPSEGTPQEGAAQYKVNVKHYAHYEETGDIYSQEMQKSLSYAARTPFSRFLIDMLTILTRPVAFWKGQDLHPVTVTQLHIPHLTVLVVLRMIAVFIGNSLKPGGELSTSLIQSIAQGFLIFALVWAFAIIVAGISALTGTGFHFDRGLRFAGYSITPIIIVGIIGFIPVPYLATICDLLSMPWAFVVLGAGILPYLKLNQEHAPMLTGLFCGILVILWSVMPMLIPYLIGLEFWH